MSGFREAVVANGSGFGWTSHSGSCPTPFDAVDGSLKRGGSNELAVTISETAYIGVATQVVVTTAAGTVQVFAQNSDPGGRVPAAGSNVMLSWSPESTFVVDRGEEGTE